MERLDQLATLGMFGHQEVDSLGPGSSGVLVCVPFRGGHLGKERLHLVGVIEQLPVQVARVPIDQDAAEVEDHRARAYRRDRAHSFPGANITIGIGLAVRSW